MGCCVTSAKHAPPVVPFSPLLSRDLYPGSCHDTGSPILCVSISPCGRKVAVSSKDGLIRIYDWSQAMQSLITTIPRGVCSDIAFCPTGRQLLSILDNGTACVHNLVSGTASVIVSDQFFYYYDWSPCGSIIAVSSSDSGSLGLYTTFLNTRIGSFRCARSVIKGIRFVSIAGRTCISIALTYRMGDGQEQESDYTPVFTQEILIIDLESMQKIDRIGVPSPVGYSIERFRVLKPQNTLVIQVFGANSMQTVMLCDMNHRFHPLISHTQLLSSRHLSSNPSGTIFSSIDLLSGSLLLSRGTDLNFGWPINLTRILDSTIATTNWLNDNTLIIGTTKGQLQEFRVS